MWDDRVRVGEGSGDRVSFFSGSDLTAVGEISKITRGGRREK